MRLEAWKHKIRNAPALLRSGAAIVGGKVAPYLGALSVIGTLHGRIHRFYQYVPNVGLHFGAGQWIYDDDLGRATFIPDFGDSFTVDFGLLSARKITKTGVQYLVSSWQAGNSNLGNLNFHGVGTGVTAEANTDTVLVTESTTALNPDSTRATGAKTVVGTDTNVLQSVGTVLFDAGAAITEHGLFSQAATGGGTLWDRSVFSAINVASGDSIQFTYQCTVNYEP